jgi:hypothetical protein
MGGIGSGRRNQMGKKTTADLLRLDVRQLQREGLLVAGLLRLAMGRRWQE